MSRLYTFQEGNGEALGFDIDEEFDTAVQPIRQRSQAELDIITQGIRHALKLERVVAEQVAATEGLASKTEIDISIIEQPSST